MKSRLVLKLRISQIKEVLERRLRINAKDTSEIIKELSKCDRKNHMEWDQVVKIKEAEKYGDY